ncbi:hypothetical protein H2198_001652 [Neophaeococcomyces mojaviensis]|uniref:Uncharacterized protein n=1 Tax=Neophaeococcomyces mojaviensis TaxID=3383035 RepID=A0ACC3AG93_9EURO|nr:hypothetical protein H2198_001652 [Knufia sp. JES_112]
MEGRPMHKRSKSSRLLDAIRGSSPSRSELDSPTSPVDATYLMPTSDPNRLTPTSTNISTVSDSPLERTVTHRSSAEHQKPATTGLSTTPSIQDSVKTFKVFEALRSKDAAAVQKAIQDSSPTPSNPQPIPGTTILHLAIQCAEPQIVDQVIDDTKGLDVNAQDRDGNTPLHLAAQLGRAAVVNKLLEKDGVNDAVSNRAGKTPLDLARTPEIFSQLQLARSLFLDSVVKQMHAAVAKQNYKRVEEILTDSRTEASLDVNALELATEPATVASGGTLLHEAARNKDLQLAQLLLLHGADPFRRDRRGKLPQDVTKDERTKAILKKSPAAAAAQRGVQEKAILGSNPAATGADKEQGKESREMKGYLKKWTNYTSGYKLRWFVLEDGVLSYYKHQDDAGSACRGAINMRIAALHMDAQDKTRFEIQGKSSVKYHLKANHVVEAKRWFWALNNAIQFTKDEAKEDERRRVQDSDISGTESVTSKARPVSAALSVPAIASSKVSFKSRDDDDSFVDLHGQSVADDEIYRAPTHATATVDGEEDHDDASSHEMHHPETKDAFAITAQSAKLQLDLLSRVSGALNSRQTLKPDTPISDPDVTQALATYETAVSSLHGMISDLLKIARDREAYWQYRLERDADARKMWEESMAAIAYEHEDLKKSIAESEDKRKRTKRALKDVLEGQTTVPAEILGETQQSAEPAVTFNIRPEAQDTARRRSSARQGGRRKSVIAQYTNVSDSESGDDEEFFDAIDAGEIEVVAPPLMSPPPVQVPKDAEEDPLAVADPRTTKQKSIEPSYKGYEAGIRKKLKLAADNRPKISLWGILKSMIGKDMTKMTLPVSFNEPTSLLYRVAEDMEYADLLDIAADRDDSLERLVYVAGFAASEYASTIGRVAKPFNPLLGETYEYVRPDKGYRFFAEQVSHHPPVGAAYAESARWDYYGESAVKTKFLGKSFDANPLGTWFLKLRPKDGKEELYTWKKVTSTVIGIITGNPTIDNYGAMEIKNWTTGEVCLLDFRARGWKASSAYHVIGKVMDRDRITKWSIGGRWNDKIYARVTEGFEDEAIGEGKTTKGANQAILVWQAGERPPNIPFNLTPFVVTFNDDNPQLKTWLAPTDSRLRPDQRAMEDGEYDLAATEKNRVEEKQRAARRQREAAGEEWKPRFFEQTKHPVTGELYWEFNGDYWRRREGKDWSVSDDIF